MFAENENAKGGRFLDKPDMEVPLPWGFKTRRDVLVHGRKV